MRKHQFNSYYYDLRILKYNNNFLQPKSFCKLSQCCDVFWWMGYFHLPGYFIVNIWCVISKYKVWNWMNGCNANLDISSNISEFWSFVYESYALYSFSRFELRTYLRFWMFVMFWSFFLIFFFFIFFCY